MTATFLQTNFNTQDPATYKGSIDANFAVLAFIGGAFAPHQAATPNMTVVVDAGKLLVNGSLVTQAAQTTGTITAPVTYPRIDRVVIDEITGAVSVVAGTEASSPTAPAIPSGKRPVAQVALSVGQSSIINANITDERCYDHNTPFPSGTKLVFAQASAPAGWTQDTSANDMALRVVSGTGGGTGGSMGLSSATTGNHTLITSEIPNHPHTATVTEPNSGQGHRHGHCMPAQAPFDITGGTGGGYTGGNSDYATTGITVSISNTGGDGAHNHPLALAYVDVIVCTKN